MNSATSFYQSPLFSAILTSAVTFIVGLFVFIAYQKQQSDKKKDAANILLLEIINAEEHLIIAKESIIKDDLIREDVFVLPTAKWDALQYLFARDFSRREWTDINTFYEKCKHYDKVVEYNNTFFVKNEEQIRTNLQSALSDYTKGLLSTLANAKTQEEANESQEQYKKLLDAFAKQFMQQVTSAESMYFYRPKKTLIDATTIVNTVRTDLSTSAVGIKLERIINQNFRSYIHDYLLGKKGI